MRLSTYSDYALRALMYAALRAPELATIDDVATAFGISRDHVVKVVHALGRGGYLKTRRGVGGGFTLARPTAKITVGEIIRLTEADDIVINCRERRGAHCRILSACRLKVALDEAAAAFFAVLDDYTLEDLVARPAALKELLPAP